MPNAAFRRYVVAFLILLMLFVVAPVPVHYLRAMAGAEFGPGSPDMITGASTIGQVSECDTDKRSITAMLAQDVGHPIIDGSFPGLSVEAAVNVSGVIARTRRVRNVIITSGWVDLANAGTLSAHDYTFFRLVNADLDLGLSFLRVTGLKSIFYNSETIHDPFVFKGQHYAGSDTFIRDLFIPETSAATCPENDGHDMKRVEAIYYHQMIERAPAPELATLIVSLSRRLEHQDGRLIFAMMPLNFEMIGRLDPSWADIIRRRRDAFLGTLRAGGVDVLDLSEDLPSQDFATRWCGCTHYGQAGRAYVAQKLAQSLGASPAAAKERLSLTSTGSQEIGR